MTKPKRWLRERPYFDPETGERSSSWLVMQEPPPGATRPPWIIAIYGDKSAAEEHVRTGRKPREYGY